VVRTGVMQGTYNLEVADWHTYFVGDAGVWVHNAKNCGLGAAGGSSRGGESEATVAGRRAHDNYGTALGNSYDTRVKLPSGKKPDAVDWVKRDVRELKPDNPRAVARGQRQVESYRQELEEMTGEPWTSAVDVHRATAK
jgi:hypothetical protein